MRGISFGAVLVWLIGCARPNYAESSLNALILSSGPQLGYAIKQIAEQHAPITLVAEDGSVCRTSPERFSGSRPGRWIACIWNLPNLDSLELAVSPD
jgi:hypothetical protein